ncbi:MAG: plasmid pRiA4b ORF-3 family protein [Turicibacter sp.]|nr:plasmid pRiA4b ORF-3 family protein [Turicibacter sp.]
MKAIQVKIELEGLNVWRRVVMPAEVSFNALHRVIQYSMGWYNCHLYQFELPGELILVETSEEVEEYSWMNEMPTYDGRPRLRKTYRLSKNVKVDKYVKVGQSIPYVYDMGDYWEHQITVEKMVEDYPYVYPICLEGEGACPPEDCGGVPGYLELLEIIKNPTHEEHEHVIEWLKENEYESSFNLEETNWWMKEGLKLKRPKK